MIRNDQNLEQVKNIEHRKDLDSEIIQISLTQERIVNLCELVRFGLFQQTNLYHNFNATETLLVYFR